MVSTWIREGRGDRLPELEPDLAYMELALLAGPRVAAAEVKEESESEAKPSGYDGPEAQRWHQERRLEGGAR